MMIWTPGNLNDIYSHFKAGIRDTFKKFLKIIKICFGNLGEYIYYEEPFVCYTFSLFAGLLQREIVWLKNPLL